MPSPKILFLGYSSEKTRLIDELKKNNCEVTCKDEKVSLLEINFFDLVILFGYRHILRKEFFSKFSVPFINLHISYLPWNRGSHPNFWSFYENTPSGVTIHLVDEGIDTGPILFQKEIKFNKKKETFSDTYRKLILEVENLFIENINSIINKDFVPIPQKGKGTYHELSDLPSQFRGWDSNISNEIEFLNQFLI